MNKKVIILVLGMALTILAGCNNINQPVEIDEIVSLDTVVEQEQVVEVTETAEKAVYLDYSEELYTSLLGEQPLALFFHASWCPTCRAMEKDITETLDSFPAGTKIVKVDYDNSSELKRKYEVLNQSTIVVLNSKGEVVEKLLAPDSAAIKVAVEKSF